MSSFLAAPLKAARDYLGKRMSYLIIGNCILKNATFLEKFLGLNVSDILSFK